MPFPPGTFVWARQSAFPWFPAEVVDPAITAAKAFDSYHVPSAAVLACKPTPQVQQARPAIEIDGDDAASASQSTSGSQKAASQPAAATQPVLVMFFDKHHSWFGVVKMCAVIIIFSCDSCFVVQPGHGCQRNVCSQCLMTLQATCSCVHSRRKKRPSAMYKTPTRLPRRTGSCCVPSQSVSTRLTESLFLLWVFMWLKLKIVVFFFCFFCFFERKK